MSALAWHSPPDLVGDRAQPVSVGDVIRTSANFHPHYRVIAITEDRAWIRDTQHGTDHVVPLDRCQRI